MYPKLNINVVTENTHRGIITVRLTCLDGLDSTKPVNMLLFNISKAAESKQVKSKSVYQGRTSGHTLFLLACIHPVMSCRANWILHPSTSLGSFKQATPCMQARIMCSLSFYLVGDFEVIQEVS